MKEAEGINLTNPNNLEDDEGFNRFWRSFKSWFQGELPETEILQSQYRGYNNWDNGYWYIDIDFKYEYNLHLGITYPDVLESDNPSIEDAKTFIELIYSELLCKNKRYDFTISLNKRLEKFKIPYRMQNGCLIKQGYKTTNRIDKIFNYVMFERKIHFSEEMIISNEILDKKVALDYIIDALQYFISINAGSSVKDKYKSTAKAVNDDENGKTYAVIKDEIEEVMKIANEFFDIRHNEYLNKAKETREAITDGMLIEYLYNRVYALLFLLRIKNNNTRFVIS